ncbi:unnamed protein product, partial [Ectocarpus fasciculatus]
MEEVVPCYFYIEHSRNHGMTKRVVRSKHFQRNIFVIHMLRRVDPNCPSFLMTLFVRVSSKLSSTITNS